MSKPHGKAVRQQGFTLFEVAVSLLLVSFGVLSVLMIYPMGIKQVQVSRSRILAGTKALEMIELFSGTTQKEQLGDVEPPEPWEGNSYAYSNCRWDLEAVLSNHAFGIMPVPTTIARRIDSDGEEIRRILDDGGQLYYVQTADNAGLDRRWRKAKPPNEANRLVFAIVGYAQNNAIPRFPWKSWPYRAPHPSPPSYSITWSDTSLRSTSTLVDNRTTRKLVANTGDRGSITYRFLFLESWFAGTIGRPDQTVPGNCDPALASLFTAALDFIYDGNGQAIPTAPSNQKRKAYVEQAIAYARIQFTGARIRTTLDACMTPDDELRSFILPDITTGDAGLEALGRRYDAAFSALCSAAECDPRRPNDGADDRMRMRVDISIRVQCLRFLSHAMATLAKDGLVQDVNSGVNKLASETICGSIRITPGLIRYLHERSTATIMRYSAGFPYDWGVPRPVQRCMMTDHPLIEWDLFSPPRSGHIAGSIPAAMWRPVSAQPITNLGPPPWYPGSFRNGSYNKTIPPYPAWDGSDNGFWGNPDHFTLTKPFAAADRCRQIVFWTVDWHQYEDAETAPSAPVDASRHPLRSPVNASSDYRNLTMRLAGNDSQWRINGADLMTFNPELNYLFSERMEDRTTGTDVSGQLVGISGSDILATRMIPSKNRTATIFCGIHGADRNDNKLLDRGPLRSYVQLHATLVSRYNYYDPRIPLSMR